MNTPHAPEPRRFAPTTGLPGLDAVLSGVAPGDNIVCGQYGFLAYRISALGCEAQVKLAPEPNFKAEVDALLAQVDDRIRQLVDDMLETMYDAPGIGLAAPQIGVMRRMIVMDCMKDAPPEPMVLLNPEVIWSCEDLSTYEEGCLSIPDQYAEVKRPASVAVRWTGLDGVAQEEQFDGIWATCVQHEIDHLNGKLFIDYLGLMKRQMITRKMEKLKRERARG